MGLKILGGPLSLGKGGGLQVKTSSGPTTLAADTFTGADSASSLVGRSTPTGSKLWTRCSGTGAWGISSNQAYKSDTNSTAPGLYVDAGFADVTVQCDFTTPASLADDRGLLLRYADNSNFIVVFADPTGWFIQKTVAGSGTNVSHAGTPAINTTYTLKAVMSGSAVSLYVNGTLTTSGTIADAALLAATKHGFNASATATTAARWDNFSITKP